MAPGECAPGDVADPEGDAEQQQPEDKGGGHLCAAREPYALRQDKLRRRVEVHPRRRLRQSKLLVPGTGLLRICHVGLASGLLT